MQTVGEESQVVAAVGKAVGTVAVGMAVQIGRRKMDSAVEMVGRAVGKVV